MIIEHIKIVFPAGHRNEVPLCQQQFTQLLKFCLQVKKFGQWSH